MSRRGKWKNTPEGKTVKRNALAQYFTSRPVELLTSSAFRILSLSAHRALARIESELRQHAGNGNGKLIVTKEQFIEFGIERRAIAPALRELDALGIAIITVHGRGGNAEHKQPNRFLLNYMCGAVDAHDLITNSWKRFKTLEEADEVAATARANKDPLKVAYGRRTAGRKNIFRGRKTDLVPGPKNGPGTANFPRPENGPTNPGTENGPTTDISGGSGEVGGKFLREAPQPPAHTPIGHNAGPPLEQGAINGGTSERDRARRQPLGDHPVGPFATNAEAWAWIERHTDVGWDDTERYNRIRMAMNGSYEPGI
jgi:hypothetical protein